MRKKQPDRLIRIKEYTLKRLDDLFSENNRNTLSYNTKLSMVITQAKNYSDIKVDVENIVRKLKQRVY